MEKARVSVKALVEHSLRRGDLRLDLLDFGNPLEGTRAHQRIQAGRPDEYRKEVALSCSFESDGWLLEVHGRADGVLESEDRVVIEEIKTTRRDLSQLAAEENALHWGQLQVYAFQFAVDRGLERIECDLTYYHLDSGRTLQLSRRFEVDQLSRFFEELARSYLMWTRRLSCWIRTRNASIQTLEFPFGDYRQGQRTLAVAVYKTIKGGGQILVEAPTGIGKTIGAIFPGVKALAEGSTERLYYLTARSTGQQAAERALADLRIQGLRLKTLTLTAKDRICFNPGKNCNGEECEFARGYYDRLPSALEALFELDCLDRPTVESVARRHSICPFAFSLELSLWVDALVGDYNYVFDPRVSLRKLWENPGSETLLVDEAHNLLERARDMYSAELRRSSFLDVGRQLGTSSSQVSRSLRKIAGWMSGHETERSSRDPFAEPKKPVQLERLLRSFSKKVRRWLSQSENRTLPGAVCLLRLYFEVGAFLRLSEQYDNTYATCYLAQDGDYRVRLFCIDPSSQLSRVLRNFRSVALFSATLKPLHYYKRCLGCGDSAKTLELAPPFPAEHLCVVIADQVSTRYFNRHDSRHQVTGLLSEFADDRNGNYLFFFPSYHYLQMIHAEFILKNPRVRTLAQQRELSLQDREAFLEHFSPEPAGSLAGFAVMGGLFAEGIDLVGERLAGVAIVGVGLPAVCLERELIRNYFAALEGDGFDFAYRYPGIMRVRQAAGRLIRSETDRGAILLIDERFTRARYRNLFPAGWHPIQIRRGLDMRNVLNRFWNGFPRGPSTEAHEPTT